MEGKNHRNSEPGNIGNNHNNSEPSINEATTNNKQDYQSFKATDTVAKKKRSKLKIFIAVLLLILIVLAAAAVIIVPAYISSDSCRQIVMDMVSESTQGTIDIGSLKMGWFSGVRAGNIEFSDKEGFANVRVKQVATQPSYGALITGKLSLGKTVIDEPEVIIQLPKEPARDESEVPHTDKGLDSGVEGFTLPIQRIELVVNNGSVNIQRADKTELSLSQINSQVNLRKPHKKSEFAVAMQVAGDDQSERSAVSVKGDLKPGPDWSLAGAIGNLSIEIENLELDRFNTLFTLAGLDIQTSGQITGSIESDIEDGKFAGAVGNIQTTDVEIAGQILAGDRLKTKVLDIDISMKRSAQMMDIEKLKIKTDWADADVVGSVPLKLSSLTDMTKSDSQLNGIFNIDVGSLCSQIPKTLGIREDMAVNTGKLAAKVTTTKQDNARIIKGYLTLADLTGTVSGKVVKISQPITAETNLRCDTDQIYIDQAKLNSSFAQLSAKGPLDKIEYQSQADLTELTAQAGQFVDLGGYNFEGQISESGIISIEENIMYARGKTLMTDIKVSKGQHWASEAASDIDFDLGYDMDKKQAIMKLLDMQTSFGTVAITDSVAFCTANGDVNLNLQAGSIDIAKALSWAQLFGAARKDLAIKGKADADLNISGKSGVYHAITKTATIKAFELKYGDEKPFSQDQVTVDLDATIDTNNKTVNIDKFELLSDQIKIKGNLKQSKTGDVEKIQGKTTLTYNWKAVQGLAGDYFPKGLVLKGVREDTVEFSSEYRPAEGETLQSKLLAKASIGFDQAEFKGLNVGKTHFDVNVIGPELRIAPFETSVNQGKLSFGGTTHLTGGKRYFRFDKPMQILKDVRINEQMSRELLTFMNPVFANAVDVSGLANFKCDKLLIPLDQSQQDQAELAGMVSLLNVNLKSSGLLKTIMEPLGIGFSGQQIAIQPTDIVLKEGSLRYENMRMDIGDNPVNFKGTIGLDKKLDMDVVLPYTVDGRTVKLDDADNPDRMIVPLGGTADNPQIDMGKMLEIQLQQRLKKEIEKGLKGLF